MTPLFNRVPATTTNQPSDFISRLICLFNPLLYLYVMMSL